MISVFFQYDFLMYAMFTGIMVGFLAPFLGVFLVVRRMSLIADALSHVTLTGIAFSLLLGRHFSLFQGLNPLYLGAGFSVGASLLIERLRNVYTYYKELAIPIILSAGIGLGVVFISLADGFTNDLFSYLFGSVVTITQSDFRLIAAITLFVSGFIILFYKELFFLSFDEEQAIISGMPKRFIQWMFIIIVALVIAASMRVVGILLVSSLMTIPVASAMRLAKGFKQTFIYAVIFGEISVIVGLVASFHLNLAPGGTIVMIAVLILLITLFFTRGRHT
ncbi:metal ABC transporter permease [Texcoconibacillus texcoconensis]|uniref:Zinc transport system permease protein n=1 Tax=Texcoconibacillus texcoconensis TaxID=1095777 RepID=A0A840QRF1_9BACI|nr:metal ABC transporter permease [Texcoconibacillus texcoconensis]MBB5173908.1 zinc transport system permease protein [Texcoconibacillus texcoconensis]